MDDGDRRVRELEDVAALVPREIALSLQDGWSCESLGAGRWRVLTMPAITKDTYYEITLVEHLHGTAGALVITHGNSDAGPNLHLLIKATIISLNAHRMKPLSMCLTELFESSPPNDYGLS